MFNIYFFHFCFIFCTLKFLFIEIIKIIELIDIYVQNFMKKIQQTV